MRNSIKHMLAPNVKNLNYIFHTCFSMDMLLYETICIALVYIRLICYSSMVFKKYCVIKWVRQKDENKYHKNIKYQSKDILYVRVSNF